MNRMETRCHNLEQEILASKKWARMVERIDMGKVPIPTKPREVQVSGRLRRCYAYAGEKRVVSKRDYKAASPKRLKQMVSHEMVHYFLMDNSISDSHGPIFKACCSLLGLKDGWAHEVDHKYQHICQCGWWLKSVERRKTLFCQQCHKKMVTRTEYNRLKKIASIGSQTIPINIETYAIMEIRRADTSRNHIKPREVGVCETQTSAQPSIAESPPT